MCQTTSKYDTNIITRLPCQQNNRITPNDTSFLTKTSAYTPITMKKQHPAWQLALLTAFVIVFAIYGWNYVSSQTISSLPSMLYWFAVMFAICLMFITVDRLEDKNEFKITGWKWIFYLIGLASFFGVLFWVTAWTAYNHKKKQTKNKVKFFGTQFHSTVFIWGTAITIGIIAFIFAAMLGL